MVQKDNDDCSWVILDGFRPPISETTRNQLAGLMISGEFSQVDY